MDKFKVTDDMSATETAEQLNKVGISEAVQQIFIDNEVDGFSMLQLTEDDLNKMLPGKVGVVRKLLILLKPEARKFTDGFRVTPARIEPETPKVDVAEDDESGTVENPVPSPSVPSPTINMSGAKPKNVARKSTTQPLSTKGRGLVTDTSSCPPTPASSHSSHSSSSRGRAKERRSGRSKGRRSDSSTSSELSTLSVDPSEKIDILNKKPAIVMDELQVESPSGSSILPVNKAFVRRSGRPRKIQKMVENDDSFDDPCADDSSDEWDMGGHEASAKKKSTPKRKRSSGKSLSAAFNTIVSSGTVAVPALSGQLLPSLNSSSFPSIIEPCETEARSMACIRKTFRKANKACIQQYQCLLCPVTKENQETVVKHSFTEHKTKLHLTSSIESSTAISYIFCRHCDYVSPNQMALWNHFSAFHNVKGIIGQYSSRGSGDNVTYSCKLCVFSESSKVEIEKHSVIKHGSKLLLFVCTDCDNFRTFNTKSLIDHMKVHNVSSIFSCSATIINDVGEEVNGIKRVGRNPLMLFVDPVAKVNTCSTTAGKASSLSAVSSPSNSNTVSPNNSNNNGSSVVTTSVNRTTQSTKPKESTATTLSASLGNNNGGSNISTIVNGTPTQSTNPKESTATNMSASVVSSSSSNSTALGVPSQDASLRTDGKSADAIIGMVMLKFEGTNTIRVVSKNCGNKGLMYQCFLCPTLEENPLLVYKHLLQEHSMCKYIAGSLSDSSCFLLCQHCDFVTQNHLAMTIHFFRHHSIRGVMGHYGIKKNPVDHAVPESFMCLHCKHNTDDREEMENHSVKSHGTRVVSYTCTSCNNFSDFSFGKLAGHMRIEHQISLPKFCSTTLLDRKGGPITDMKKVEPTPERFNHTFVPDEIWNPSPLERQSAVVDLGVTLVDVTSSQAATPTTTTQTKSTSTVAQ